MSGMRKYLANEGDIIVLKIDVPAGLMIDEVYGDQAHNKLIQDSNDYTDSCYFENEIYVHAFSSNHKYCYKRARHKAEGIVKSAFVLFILQCAAYIRIESVLRKLKHRDLPLLSRSPEL